MQFNQDNEHPIKKEPINKMQQKRDNRAGEIKNCGMKQRQGTN